MTREEVIQLARESGWTEYSLLHPVEVQRLERFAKLVYESVFRDANIAASATIIDAAVLEEREACARMVDSFDADAIRARGGNV